MAVVLPTPFADVSLREVAGASTPSVYRTVASSPQGLTEDEVARRAHRHGENLVDVDPGPTLPGRILAALRSPFLALLAALDVVFAVVGDARGAVTLALMVVASAALRFWQQSRSDRAVKALRSRVHTTVTVRRRAAEGSEPVGREVPLEQCVPGDVVLLAPGDVVPADVRLTDTNDLRVDQAVLTGEGLPARKSADPDEARTDPERSPALCLAGTAVVSGTATGVVVATGAATYSGTLARLAVQGRPESTFDLGVRSVSWTLIRFMLVMVPIVLAVNGTVTGNWPQAGMFAAAVAVGLTPEMLPVVVTTTLARGARRLADQHVIVTRLNAIQDLGAADVLCLDKTGTLTEERVVAVHSIDATGVPDDEAADHAALAVRAQSVPDGRFDEAILARLAEPDEAIQDALWAPVDEWGFDPDRRRSTVEVRREDGVHLLITKGDPDEVLPRCDRARAGDDVVDLDRGRRLAAGDLARAHAQHGLRLLAVAVREVPRLGTCEERDETAMVLVGFVAFVDPVRGSAPEAVRRLAEHGVEVRVLTGDNPHTAARVAAQAGIRAGDVVEGATIDAVGDERLGRIVEDTRVFARLTPAQKARVVAALRARGRAVGFVGDGVNDVPALQTADVGIVPASAVPAAKRAADLILTDPDLAVVASGVVEGRRTLGNTLKYVTITAGSNFGNVVTVLAASVFLPFLPMLPLQLVVQNLLYDAAQLALPWDRVDRRYLRAPRRWDTRGLVRFMLVFGPLSSLFDLATFAVLWWGVDGGRSPEIFRAGWFVEGLISQLVVVLVLRSRGAPWRGAKPAVPLLLASAGAAVLGLLVVTSPVGALLALQAPPPSYLLWLVVTVSGYAGLAQVVKVRLGRSYPLLT
ncbi:magnesium-translocating P-type ATPase [Actinomycetospora endophytica]|uniref:Magnesium-transporting ATPase, P-type 1 n=1 Tax=Actinomycetospora endophytica TaxID=2291215 RepID=A0ABS8PA80_9PSEU|nr:magnesium-translocating P-type ATPase [Actinomycetospora endophytica]MCD2195188.1 magnesium-translocating P-type ATPase [Actinomycetospora endophytica]